MGKKETKQKPEQQSGNFLDLIPAYNNNWDTAEDGRIYLLVPRWKNKLMKKIMLRFGRSEFVKVYFDQTGTKVWAKIDGKRTIGQIGADMELEKDETEEQKYNRLGQFFGILARNKFVGLKDSINGGSPPNVSSTETKDN